MNEIATESRWIGTLLDAAAKRHRAVSSNLANASTEGYRPVRIEFEQMLRKMLARPGRLDLQEIADIRAEVVPGADGRGVAIEEELMALMKNQLAYDTYAQVLTMKVGLLKAAIRSGKGA